MADDRKILYRFVQNDTNFMLLTQSEFKGKEYYDVRKYFINDKGQEIATKKGLMLSAEEWQKVVTILQDFIQFVENEKEEVKQEYQPQAPKQEVNNEPNTGVFDYKVLDNIDLGGDPFADDTFEW